MKSSKDKDIEKKLYVFMNTVRNGYITIPELEQRKEIFLRNIFKFREQAKQQACKEIFDKIERNRRINKDPLENSYKIGWIILNKSFYFKLKKRLLK